jgi:transcriptional regulator with XRE-family HTH domain
MTMNSLTPARSADMSSTSPTTFNKRLGAAVRAKRILAGLSQDAVGMEISVTFQQVQKYERGVNRISVETLIKIAKAINATPQGLIDVALFDEVPEPASTKQPRERMTLQVVRGLSRMPEKSQRIALDVINALAGDEAA